MVFTKLSNESYTHLRGKSCVFISCATRPKFQRPHKQVYNKRSRHVPFFKLVNDTMYRSSICYVVYSCIPELQEQNGTKVYVLILFVILLFSNPSICFPVRKKVRTPPPTPKTFNTQADNYKQTELVTDELVYVISRMKS